MKNKNVWFRIRDRSANDYDLNKYKLLLIYLGFIWIILDNFSYYLFDFFSYFGLIGIYGLNKFG